MKRYKLILCALMAVTSCREETIPENRNNAAMLNQQPNNINPDMEPPYRITLEPKLDPRMNNEPFNREMEALDSILYTAAYNNKDTVIARKLIHDDFEFYHDRNGELTDMDTASASEIMIQRFRDIGNHYKRKLKPGTLRSYPLYNGKELYGAIQEGVNQYHKTETGALEGVGHFMHLWVKENNQWKLKRVISYNHRAVSQ
ncbi:nuclear transport factor 2 family protein [Robertkochia sediminum]|uniref:nuclear transport factor 2 family protein n=1 Tax=Robertkochia sediminum TaxID=2785326 RepID=UPI001931703F|nr:nuclear transport factor 2 family protein [Robertkochia sediminum]MBL7473853.1 nuclear transport factor 2 family protein [Robertkochia sediminum]